MSEIRVNNITNRDGTAGPSIAGIPVVDSNSHFVVPTGRTGQRYADGGENIVRDGLVLHLDAKYSYPGATGTNPDVYTWYDMSGNDNDGELVSGVEYSSSNGGSLVFDGSNDYIRTNLSARSAYTASIFFKVSSFSFNDMRLVSALYGDIDQFTCGWNNQYFRVWVGSSWEETSFLTQINTYYHLSIVHFLGTTQIYLGGNNIKTILNKSSYFNNFGLGNSFLFQYGYPLNGNIAQVSVYNRALTASEVSQNFNALRSRFGI